MSEFIASDIAARKGIDNSPSPEITAALENTAAGMERIRAELGNVAIHINSGYRCPKLNSVIGGQPNSQHQIGEAADFIAPAFGPPLKIARHLESRWPLIGWDQLILEFGQWVHVSFTDTPRGLILTIDHNGTHRGIVA